MVNVLVRPSEVELFDADLADPDAVQDLADRAGAVDVLINNAARASNVDLDRLDPRICSRLCDPDLCRHVFLRCGDYRMRHMDTRFLGGDQPQRSQQGERRRGQK